RVPLTSDESWNYHYVSRRGAFYALTTYELPNNHILFSALQSLLPDRLIVAWPPIIRLLNIIYGTVFLLLAQYLLKPNLGSVGATIGAAALVLCNPLFTLYFFIARGYLLGSLLLLISLAIAATGRKFALSAIFAGLATLCVPTFALALPG